MADSYKYKPHNLKIMLNKVAVFGFLIILCITEAQGQCIPDPVYDINLDTDGVLTWDYSHNCPIENYLVTIYTEGTVAYSFSLDSSNLSVSFLPYCMQYTYTINAMSNHVTGPSVEYNATLKLPQDVDILIDNFRGSPIDSDVLLQWNVEPKLIHCVDAFIMKLWDEDTEVVKDLTLHAGGGYYLLDAPKCMKYKVEVYVRSAAANHTSVTNNYTVPGTITSLYFRGVRQDTATINTTWSFESYSRNRCKITGVHLNSTRLTPTIIPIEDTPQRPNIDVSLTGLRVNSMYYFNLTVENEAGLSKPYQIAVQTLPIDPNL